MKLRSGALAALFSILGTSCVTTSETSRTWMARDAASAPERYGRVEWIRETVRKQEGHPAGGAAVGALVGGLLGRAIGHTGGALVGAVGGGAAGAGASEGSAERRTYEVAVRCDDGTQQVFQYDGYPPFSVGDAVALTPSGLQSREPMAAAPPTPDMGG